MPISTENFPNLHAGNHRITSPSEKRYNCIAWAAGRDDEFWDPAEPEGDEKNYFFWPEHVPRDFKLASLIMVYESVCFVLCPDGSQEPGFEKVAIYADGDEYMHAALQLETGRWTSKMGKGEDIEHDVPEDLAGPCYGSVVAFMKRRREPARTDEERTLEETQDVP